MGDVINARVRFATAKSVRIATHKFAVGALVAHSIGHRMESAIFRIVSHLPDGGGGLQYRIRSDRDGHERVAVESALAKPQQDSGP